MIINQEYKILEHIMEKLDPKIDGSSKDIVQENIDKLKEVFPEAFTENKVDFNKLKEALGDYIEDREERYSFSWHGKSKARRIAQTPSTGTLRPCKEESKDWDTTQNLFIEGDNLEVLKLLQKSYHKKIKMIYIDPPYNTGNEFIYPDNYKDNLDTYLKYSCQIDDDGYKFSSNTEQSGRYHTNWLNMMYPRLKLARNLLRDDGVIFISIDDNEVSNLRKICDEIFGEENFVNTIAVKMSEATGVKMSHVNRRLPKLKEYILFYKKVGITISPVSIPKDKWDNEYKHLICGVTKEELTNLKKIMFAESSSNQDIIYADEICKKINLHSINKLFQESDELTQEEKLKIKYKNAWRIVRDVATTGGAKKIADKKKRDLNTNFFIIVTPRNKKYLIKSDYNASAQQPRIKLLFADSYLTKNPGDFWQDIKTTGLDNEGYVDFKNGKKPLKMIDRLLQQSTNNKDIILDFFAGSCTSGHAVLDLNKKDRDNRKFIMIQLPEPCNEKSKTFKIEYKTIADIGKDRIRLAGNKIVEENHDKKGIENLDIGFKVFKLDSSNIKPWDTGFDRLEDALWDSINNIKTDRTEADVLYELLLKYGLDLTLPIEEREIHGKVVFSIGLGALVICLDSDITIDVVEGIGKLKQELDPEIMRVVFKDSGFKDDVVKTNAIQILKRYNIEDVKSL
jgi:adenine-specific DNA-methyltransferase